MSLLQNMIGIVEDNWLLLLVGQYPNGPLGGLSATIILSVLGIALAFPLSVVMALARLRPGAYCAGRSPGSSTSPAVCRCS